MTSSSEAIDEAALERARFGDSAAFEALVSPHLALVQRLVRRMIGHPEDTADVVQDTLLRAFSGIASFRSEARLSTWLCSIATRAAIDHLRARRRWGADVKLRVRAHMHETPERDEEVMGVLLSPANRFDAREHIAFCFTCVGRSLDPEEQAALVLRDVLGCSNREAADAVGVSEPVLRHRLDAARAHMQETYEGLCGIVSKTGVCHQCAGLRDRVPADRNGPPVPPLGADGDARETRFVARLRVVSDADIHAGATQPFHDLVWRAMDRLER